MRTLLRRFVLLLSCFAIACQGSEEGTVAGGAAKGAVIGAVAGLALGAIVGKPERGLAIGAIAGGVKGGLYEYDQGRQDRRMRRHAEAIGGAMQGETNDQAGLRHLQDGVGSWDMTIWALDEQGKRINGTGRAEAVLISKNQLRVTWSDIREKSGGPSISGTSIFTFSDSKGFRIDSNWSDIGKEKMIGEYIAPKQTYNYYLVGGDLPKGVSNVRVEIAQPNAGLINIKTFAAVDGKEYQIQGYRLTRRS
ncbi:MAG: glycine zipper family protein [Planctomycetota bacterium]